MLLFAFVLYYISFSAAISVTSVANIDPNSYSKLTLVANPVLSDASSITVKAERLEVGKGNGSAEAAAFQIYTPAAHGDIGFYFGFFEAQASYDPTQNSIHVDASALELVANFLWVVTYADRNSEPGFQYVLGDEIDCDAAVPPATDLDCVYLSKGSIQLKDCSWGPITLQKISCPAGYSSACEVHVFTATTNGTDEGLATFVFKLATQPVYIDGVLVTQDYGKIDIDINFPWANPNYSSLPDDTKVGLIAGTGGKTAAVSATLTKIAGQPAVQFTSDGYIGAFTWVTSSTIVAGKKRSTSTVYYQQLTGEEIGSYQCNILTPPLCNGVVDYLKIVTGIWEAFGWKVSFLFFSWDDTMPDSITWDPIVGLSTSAGLRVEAVWWVALVVMLMHLWRF